MNTKVLCELIVICIAILAVEITVQPVKADTGLNILPTDSGFLNDKSLYYIAGEVNNNGSVTETNVYINATFYDVNGTVLAEVSQPTKLLYILPNKTSPFDITLYPPIELSQQVHNYTLNIVQSNPSSDRPTSLEITSNGSSQDSNGFHIEGTIRNTGIQSTSFTRVIATFYSANGHVIGTVLNSSSPSFLDSNQSSPFNLVLNASTATLVDHYALEAESYDYELIPEFQPPLLILALTTIGAIAVQATRRSKKTLNEPARTCKL